MLVGNHAEEILKCDCFEAIVEFLKTTIPQRVVDDTDDICTRALDMDIKQQLNLYEVEYQLLHEEMIDIRQSRERLEKQELAQKELESKVKCLEKELTKANETICTLKAELNVAKRSKDCDSLDSSCDGEMLSLKLDQCGRESPRCGMNISNNNYGGKVSSLVSSPDSFINDVTIHVNGDGPS